MLMVPLVCVIDYFGIVFEVQTPFPISINTLVYGSDTQGLLFKNDHEEAEQMAKHIGEILNLKPYTLKERASGVAKDAYLPYGV